MTAAIPRQRISTFPPVPHLADTAALHAGLGDATTAWHAAVALATYWRAHRSADPARSTTDPERCGAWADLVSDTERTFASAITATLTPDDHAAMSGLIGEHADPDDVDAVCWGLNLAYGSTFASSWRSDIADELPLMPMQPGQPYPVALPRWPHLDGDLLPQPAASTRPDPGEYPYLRFYDVDRFQVIASFEHHAPLTRIFNSLTSAVTLHPNGDHAADFDFVVERGQFFPLVPRRPDGQAKRIHRLLDAARDDHTDAAIILGPELCLTPDIANSAAAHAATWGRRRALLIPGSFHHYGQLGAQRNTAVGFITGRRHYPPLDHDKMRPITDELRLGGTHYREGIHVADQPVLTIHHADAYRLAILVCKDFLDDHVHVALTRMGVNIVCVAAMSEKTGLFPLRAAHRAAAQGLTVVANGPERWPDRSGKPVRAADAAVTGIPAGEEPVRRYDFPASPGLRHVPLTP